MNNIMLEGLIRGIEQQGGKFIRQKENELYFEIPRRLKGESIQNAKKILNSQGLRLFTKINEDL